MSSVQSVVSSCAASSLQPLSSKKQHAVFFSACSAAGGLAAGGSAAPSCVQFDVAYRTYPDTDTLAMYFAKVTPGLIVNTDDIAPGIVTDYTEDDRLVSLDINSASMSAACHTFDTGSVVNGQPPLVTVEYDPVQDRLAIFLTRDKHVAKVVVTEDPDISLGACADGKWLVVYVARAKYKTFTV